MNNSTDAHFCCDPGQINVLIVSGIMGTILLIVVIFWLIRQKFNYQPQRSLYDVL